MDINSKPPYVNEKTEAKVKRLTWAFYFEELLTIKPPILKNIEDIVELIKSGIPCTLKAIHNSVLSIWNQKHIP